jgi:hypothetical protein
MRRFGNRVGPTWDSAPFSLRSSSPLRRLPPLGTLDLAGLRDVDSRTKTFSCSRCGSDAGFCVVEPIKEGGMADYRLDEIEKPAHHPEAVRRLTAPPRRPVSSRGGELPGRKVDHRG